MQNPTLRAITYAPEMVPADISDINVLRRYLQSELEKISNGITQLAAGHFEKSFSPPNKPRAGDIRYADGTTWNPGGGEGIYFFNSSGVWVQMG